MIEFSEPTREPAVGAMVIVLLLGCIAGCIATALAGGWWWLLFVVLLLLAATCAYGAVDSFQLKHRED